jgi:hypothetical protein
MPRDDNITLDNLFDGSAESWLERLNAEYFVINEDGKVVVARMRRDDQLKRDYLERMKLADFEAMFMNEEVLALVPGKNPPEMKRTKVGKFWLEHPKRRQYPGGVVFKPEEECKPTEYNLWHEFDIQPKSGGSWELLQDHIYHILCRDDASLFDYVLCWMAHMIQYPHLQGEVAIVLRGDEGCGKSTLARVLMRIIGMGHAMTIANPEHLVGRFNDHLRTCVFLFGDECFFAGDKKHVGVLKQIITEPHFPTERKFGPVVTVPNHLHVMLATNEEWAIPASIKSRRFCMLDASSERIEDLAYFAAIWAELESGGYGAMLHDLKYLNLDGFDVRAVPKTAALDVQKQHSLDLDLQWWQDVLMRGYVYESQYGIAELYNWMDITSTDLLFASYRKHAKSCNHRHPMHRVPFGKFMARMGAEPQRQRAIVGEISGIGCEPKLRYQSKVHCHKLGSLSEARTAYEKATSLKIEWPEEAEPLTGLMSDYYENLD